MSDPPRPPAAGPPPPPTTAAPVSRRAWWSIVIAGSVLVIVGIWFVIATLPSFLTSSPDDADEATTGGAPEARHVQAALYYVSPEGDALVAINRQVPYGATPAEQAQRIVETQVGPAPEGAMSAFPPGTTVRHVFVTAAGEAYVDLGPEIVAAHVGGSLSEALTVFAIVNAVTTNLPDIKAVQILIDGKEVDTLAGHIDLRRPLEKSLRWIRR